MPSEQKLSEILKEFAHTLLTDTPTQAILDNLADGIVEALPVTSAGVTLIVPRKAPEYLAASDAAALRYEQLQTELAEGPGLDAFRSGEAVFVADLQRETRFPKFRARALAAGLRAVFTFPLHNGDERFGALDLYRETPGALSSEAVAAAQTLADVTSVYLSDARKRYELQELGRAQADFVSRISHELRSPLTSVLGYVELLSDGASGELNQEQGRVLGIVDRNSRRLLGMIEDLLTMSSVEAGTCELVMTDVDVGELVERVRDTMAPIVVRSELELCVDLARGTVLNGDRDQLERALLNLVSNAVKFTMPGGHVEITTRSEGDDIALSVRDTGTGIPTEEQRHLFTRFFRTMRSKENQVPGTGLGLYIVDHIVALHGGRMRVVSSPRGSTFTMVLPMRGPAPPPAPTCRSRSDAERVSSRL
jgi:signal transduction histidine kinase